MKPLDFSLEQMRDLLDTVEELAAEYTTEARVAQLQDRLGMFQAVVDARVQALREQLHRTEDFARLLRAPAASRSGRGGARR
jgi:predicted kinase